MARKYSKRQSADQTANSQQIDCTALYVRVSTEKQADEGYSLDNQISRLQAHCVAQGWETCVTFTDAGISGTSTEGRTAFNEMMDAAKRGEVKRIVAIKLDRLARNVRDFLGIVDDLESVGCDLVLVKESFDTSTPHGRFALTMFAAMAELEATTITERVMSGKQQKATEGGYNGSRCPFGYDFNDGVFTINPAQATAIQTTFESFVSGESMASIARGLNAQGIATARGGKWYTSTVRYILQNGFYAGLAQWDGKETAGTQPAIIAPALYEQAHSRLMELTPGPHAQ